MEIYLANSYLKAYCKLAKKNKQLSKKVKKQLHQFQKNPRHPSLRLHKLEGKMQTAWSISVGKSLRLVFVYVEDGILLLNFGSHDQVY